MRMKNSFGIALLIMTSGVVSACGSSSTTSTTTMSPSPSTSPMTQLQNKTPATSLVAADPTGQLVFVPKTISAKVGTNTFVFNNQSSVDHSMVIEKPGGGDLAGTPVFKGGSKKFQATLQKGTYTYYCSVPGHRQAGMVGTITVN